METTNHFNWEFETITRHTMDIILIVDRNQLIKYATPSFEPILGYNPKEIIGKNAFDPLYPEDRERLMASHREAIETGEPKTDEYRVFRKNGEVIYFESRVMPVPDNPEQLVVVSIRDITARKNMEAELQNRKDRYEELQKSLKYYSQDLSAIMNVSDLEKRLIKELEKIIPGCVPKMIKINRECESVEGDLALELKYSLSNLPVGKLQYVQNQVLVLIGDRKDYEYVLTLKAASITEAMDSIWLETLVYYTIMVFESLNIIENLMKQLETALQKKERPQWILRLLFNLSEKQRLQLSSDLHDTVLQDQIVLYRNLEELLKEHKLDEAIYQPLKGIAQGLLDTIHQIRMTCNELRPPLLRELGLEKALENLFDYTQVSSTFKIEYTTDNTENLSLSEEKTIGIFRIVQELLNNAAKHSQASHICFRLMEIDRFLKLEYSDNGKGFEAEKLNPSFNSMGLSGMRERIQSLNGTIEFFSEPGNGLLVHLQVPTGA